VNFTSSSSSGDDEIQPPVGGGGGGGGGSSPDFYDYFIPLVFNSSHIQGYSEVSIWVIQESSIQTSFAMDKSGTNVIQTGVEPVKLTFNPTDNPGLTNGSLIRSSSPILVLGHRSSQDISSDYSFGYSVLSSRMRGFEFTAPFTGYMSVVAQNLDAQIKIESLSEGVVYTYPVDLLTLTATIFVEEGAYINTTSPLNGAFITFDPGAAATMAVPKYMKGDDYVFDASLYANREDEIDRSYISIFPDEPTELDFIYKDGTVESHVIFDNSKFNLNPDLRGINSSRGEIDVSFHLYFDYAGIGRYSTVQLFSAKEMRAGELFVSPEGFTSHYGSIQNTTGIVTAIFDGTDPVNAGFYYSSRYQHNQSRYDILTYNSDTDSNIVIANDSLFGIITSPGKVGNPMSPSLAFLNIPLNGQTSKNITGLEATWYRFANLAVYAVEVIPGPLEEFTGQTIHIEIVSNGSLPSSGFTLEIQIDDEELIVDTHDFLQANTSLIYEYKRFFEYGKTELNVSVKVDVDNEVNEINEDDNEVNADFNVDPNIRLRYTGILVIVVILSLIIYKIRKWIMSQNKMQRAHIDVIIEGEFE
jgi:hypothetical protein